MDSINCYGNVLFPPLYISCVRTHRLETRLGDDENDNVVGCCCRVRTVIVVGEIDGDKDLKKNDRRRVTRLPCVVTCSIHDFVREELDVEANNERLAVDRADVSVSQGSTGVVRDVEEVDGTTGLDRIKAKKTECSKRLGVRTQRSSVSY